MLDFDKVIKINENIIGAPKMRNNYGALQYYFFEQYCDSNIRLYAIASCKDIALLNLLCFIFGLISWLLSFI